MKRFRISLHRAEGWVPIRNASEGETVSHAVSEGFPAVVHFHFGPDSIRVEPSGKGETEIRIHGRTLTRAEETIAPVLVEAGANCLAIQEYSSETDGANDEAEAPVDFHAATTLAPLSPGGNPGWDSPPEPAPAEEGFGPPRSTLAPIRSDYRLLEEIARGGMGQIYSGEDLALKRRVAVKVSRFSGAGSDPRFLREAEILAHLAHPNIVPIHAVGTDSEGRPFYSMKLIQGQTLQAILNQLADGHPETTAHYSRAVLLSIFHKVCDAVAFAHSQQILHRDLKPENVMVGEYGEVLVMDWGLAKDLRDPSNPEPTRAVSAELLSSSEGGTLDGEVMGTPPYMPPEQAEGRVSELDERSDVYSLGGILYAILTLKAPVEGQSVEEVLEKVRQGIPEVTDRRVPRALRAVIQKAMALQREDRYTSAEALADELDAYQNGFATSAEEAGMARLIRLWLRRNRLLAGSAVAMMAVIASFTAQSWMEGRRASTTLTELRRTAPIFMARSREALRELQLEEALRNVEAAVDLEPSNDVFHGRRGDLLQSLIRWPEALEAYQKALRLNPLPRYRKNLRLTEELIQKAAREGESKAKLALYDALNAHNRHREAMALAKNHTDFWKDSQRDLRALPELLNRLEDKLLPIPGTDVLMSKTEFTVGEWRLYLRAEGLPPWTKLNGTGEQTDEHPVVGISWDKAKGLCDWLSSRTGREWRLPTNAEWDAAVGPSLYPWGDDYPPRWDDGNYAIAPNGEEDPNKIGIDGIYGTAPVMSFRPNALGFYDLGGNAWEWVWDGFNKAKGTRMLRGASWWGHGSEICKSAAAIGLLPETVLPAHGFRLIRK
ncbi:MAG: hypothetical protein RLZZ399_2506 [Verrucomicrobiota bacterium]